MAEDVWKARIGAGLPSHEWPGQHIATVAIDTQTGEHRIFDRDSGVDLLSAVAASCAVPGVYPPVTIDGKRYMDGGVRTTTNAGPRRSLRRNPRHRPDPGRPEPPTPA